MTTHDDRFGGSRADPWRDLESPFLEGELFADPGGPGPADAAPEPEDRPEEEGLVEHPGRQPLPLPLPLSADCLKKLKGLRVAVVGGGLGGLMAARELGQHGVSVTVYEARDQVGGRVRSNRRFSSDRITEEGAELIGSFHTTWLRLARRYGLSVISRMGAELYHQAGLDVKLTLDKPLTVDEYFALEKEMRKRVLEPLARDASQIRNPAEPWRDPTLRSEDNKSVADALRNRYGVSPTERLWKMLEFKLVNDEVSPLDRMNHLGLLCKVRGGQGLRFRHEDPRDQTTPLMRYWDELEIFRCAEGSQTLATKMVEEIRSRFKGKVVLGRAVTHIAITKQRVLVGSKDVTDERREKLADGAPVILPYDYVVLAIPPSVWHRVPVTANDGKANLVAAMVPKMGMAPAIKFFSDVKGRFWVGEGAAPVGGSLELGQVWEGTDNQTRIGNQGIVLSVFAGPIRTDAQGEPRAPTPKEMQGELRKLYSGYDGKLNKTLFSNWPEAPFIRTGYVNPRIGEIFTTGKLLTEPFHDRLYFAGEHTHMAYFGYMEGALRSGERAADKLVRKVCGLPPPDLVPVEPSPPVRIASAAPTRELSAFEYEPEAPWPDFATEGDPQDAESLDTWRPLTVAAAGPDESPVARLEAESPFLEAFVPDAPELIPEHEGEDDFAADEEFFPEAEGESPLATLAPSELKAVRITSTFETGRAGSFGGLTGNFDGQGVSFGLMNFAWKAGSLLTLLKEFLRDHPAAFTRVFGPDAGRFREVLLATRPDPKNPRRQVRDVDRQMEFARDVLNDAGKRIREPWRTYFGRLETDPEFRRIQVAAVRRAAERARYWCRYFGLKTERAFAFMFDLVSSHGAAWLNAKKFGGRRQQMLRAMLAKKQAAVGRPELTDLEKLEVIAHMIADASAARWRSKVRVRKLWFVRGRGKVHGTSWDLAKDFGVTDAPPDFGTASAAKEFLEESEADDAGGGDLEWEWEDNRDEQFLSEEPTDGMAEEAFADEAPPEFGVGVEALCEEEDPDPDLMEAPSEVEEAWPEPGDEAVDDFEAVDNDEEEAILGNEFLIEPPEEPEFEEDEVGASLGETVYLPVRLNQTVLPKVGVFIPAGFRPTTAVDVIVYFHGHIIPACRTDPAAFKKSGIEYYWNTPLFRCLREDLAASGQNAVLIAPTLSTIFGSKTSPSSAFGDLDTAGKFDFLINETLAHLSQRGTVPAGAHARHIVLSGHSAGGRPMGGVLQANNSLRQNVVECWGFECLYFGTAIWEKWLAANPGRFFRHYRQAKPFGSPTATLGKYANFVDANDGTDHCLIVKEKWRQALDAGRALQDGVAGSPRSPATGGAVSALVGLLTGLPGLATLPVTFMTALMGGLRDETQLTNLIFFARHPELGGRKLTGSDPQSLKDEWVRILKTVVRPAIRRLHGAAPGAGTGPAPTAARTDPIVPASSAGVDDGFPLTEWKLAAGKIVVARAGSKGTAVEITEAPAVFLPQIIGTARDLATKVGKHDLAGKLDPARWFKQFTRINFLGRSLKSGQYLHLEMAKLLKAIERELVREFGGDAKGVGDRLLNNSPEGIAGSRLVSSTATFSMHMFGLAVDVNYLGNPYIQSPGDVQGLNNVLRNASLLMNRPTLSYKKGLTPDLFDSVQRLDALLETYFDLLDRPAELARLAQASTSLEWNRLTVAEAQARIQKNLDNLAGLLARGKHKAHFKRHAILDFDKRFVVRMEALGLNWGGPYGDMMHFDMRTAGVGLYVEKARMAYAGKVKALAKRLLGEKRYGTHSPS